MSDDWLSSADESELEKTIHEPATVQYLVFLVSGMEMGVSLEHVSEIVPYDRVSAVPGTPAWVRGVVHVRERVIPVIDLAVKLHRQPEPATKRTCILMFELEHAGQRPHFGLVMDGVATLLDVDRASIQQPPRFGAQAESEYLLGLLPRANGTLPLIDIARVFARDELSRAAALTNAEGVGAAVDMVAATSERR